MNLIPRADWGASPTSPAAALTSAEGVAVHYLGTRYETRDHARCAAYVRAVRDSHLRHPTENWVDIAYNLLVCEHGVVFEGRGAGRRSGANGSSAANRSHYAVCALLGASGLTVPPDAQLAGLADAVDYLRERGAGREVTGHRDHRATACPGDALYGWVQAGAPRPAAPGGTYTVQAGDTLSAIGARHGVRWEDIAEANSMTNPDLIFPGDELAIPAAAGSPARPVVDLSRLRAAARQDPPAAGQPVTYAGTRTVEAALVAEGLLDARYADGHFGTATIAAYSAWQRRLGYRGTRPGGDADGIPGRTSLTKLGGRHGFDVED